MPVTIGVDPHKASHTAAALDEHGHLLGQQRITATLAQRLVGDGEQVLDVPAKLAARVRVFDVGHGRKTDATDAHAITMAALRTRGLRQLRKQRGPGGAAAAGRPPR